MFCQCSVTVTLFRNNVSVICYMLVTGYVPGEIACNKCPVLLLFNLERKDRKNGRAGGVACYLCI